LEHEKQLYFYILSARHIGNPLNMHANLPGGGGGEFQSDGVLVVSIILVEIMMLVPLRVL